VTPARVDKPADYQEIVKGLRAGTMHTTPYRVQAADAIESLLAEVEKLREIESFCQQVVHPEGVSDDLGIDAVAAEQVLAIIRGAS
jgi:hypothetical protein